MRFFFIILLGLNAFGAETEMAKLVRSVKQRKADIQLFIEKVSKGDRCRLRDYQCFEKEVSALTEGHVEELIEAKAVLIPFYERSVKEGFPPCEKTCLANMKASHLYLLSYYVQAYSTKNKKNYRVSLYPTVDSTRIRAYMDLSAFHHLNEITTYIHEELKTFNLQDVTKEELKDQKRFKRRMKTLESGKIFDGSVLCKLGPGDPIYEEILKGETSGKKSDQSFSSWLKDFDKVRNVCLDKTPMNYRGTDESTRAYYRAIREKKMAALSCSPGDFACVRKNLKEIGIHYAEDVQKVAAYMSQFVLSSKPGACDETCEAQTLIRTIQTWVSYLSTYERENLASTLDWKEYPEARYLTITEDVTMFEALKEIFSPLILEFGKIDPKKVTDAGLKSEMKSVGKDLSDFSSGRMLKDSVICAMDPWTATYDKYMVPFKNKELDKKFEISFLDFKEALCK